MHVISMLQWLVVLFLLGHCRGLGIDAWFGLMLVLMIHESRGIVLLHRFCVLTWHVIRFLVEFIFQVEEDEQKDLLLLWAG